MNDLVAIIFRLINFAVALGASCYVFKRYVIPMIVADIDQRQKDLNELNAKAIELAKQEKEAKQAIVDQQHTYQRLQKKLEQWNTVFNATVVHRNREKQQLIDALAQKAVQQQNYITTRHAQNKVLPAALRDAQHQLTKQFQDSATGQSYIEKLIAHMRRVS